MTNSTWTTISSGRWRLLTCRPSFLNWQNSCRHWLLELSPCAQTERRGRVVKNGSKSVPPIGPMRALLGRKDLTGRLLLACVQSSFSIVPMPRYLVNSELLLLPNRSR